MAYTILPGIGSWQAFPSFDGRNDKAEWNTNYGLDGAGELQFYILCEFGWRLRWPSLLDLPLTDRVMLCRDALELLCLLNGRVSRSGTVSAGTPLDVAGRAVSSLAVVA